MLRSELEKILARLLELNAVFSFGFIHNSRDMTQGLGQASGNFLYLIEDVGRDGFNGFVIEPAEGAKDLYLVAENWKLIVSIRCVDRFLILKRLIGQLILETPGVSIQINGYSTDAEIIYEDETGEKLTSDIDIIRINFTIRKGVTTSGLDCQPICDADCC